MAADESVLTGAVAERLCGDWRRLATGGSYFQTPDWALSWWEARGRPRTHVATWRRPDGTLDGLAALTLDRERFHPWMPPGVRVWTNTGSGAGAADDCGWLLQPGRVADARRWAQHRAGHRPLLLRGVAAAARDAVPAGARLLGRTRCPRLELAAAGDDFPTPPAFAKRLRQYRRRLLRDGVTFEWVAPGTFGGGTWDELLALHAARRGSAGRPTAFGDAFTAVHRGLAARAAADRGPAAVVARHAGATIGVLYGFVWQDTFSYYQSGWAPAWAPRSLGTALVAEAVALARRQGLAVFDFMRGPDPYKYRFGAVDRVDESWLVPNGPAGRLLLAKHAVRAARSRRRGGTTGRASDVEVQVTHP